MAPTYREPRGKVKGGCKSPPIFLNSKTIKNMYSTKSNPTSEEEHQAEVRHFTTKNVKNNKKMSDAERAELKTRMYLHPAKRHSPVGFNH